MFLKLSVFLAVLGFSAIAHADTQIVSSENMCLAIQDASLARGALIIQRNCNDRFNQEFQMITSPEGFYKIRSVRSGQCLDLPTGNSANGVAYQQWGCGDADTAHNQEFSFSPVAGGYMIRNRIDGKCLSIDGANIIQEECNGSAMETFHLADGVLPPLPVIVDQGGWSCLARNKRGGEFVGRANNRDDARENAVNKCYAAGSAFCAFIEGSCHFAQGVKLLEEAVPGAASAF